MDQRCRSKSAEMARSRNWSKAEGVGGRCRDWRPCVTIARHVHGAAAQRILTERRERVPRRKSDVRPATERLAVAVAVGRAAVDIFGG